MELKIKTTGKRVELTNYILAQAIEELKQKEHIREHFGLTLNQVLDIERFRMTMIKTYLKK